MAKLRKQVYGQLMLFATLLLGIVAMHTLGHPSGHGTMAAPEHRMVSVHAMSSAQSAHSARSHEQVPAADTAQAAPAAPVLTAGSTPMSGMDLSAVCLAVLGTFTFLVLVTVALGRPGSAAAAPSGARPTRAPWPDPPPPRTLLARLSVLRI